jgi:L-threonylcarbamoyladenylate synthase
MEISDGAKLLMKKHWPGPMTLILKKKDTVPSIVTAGLDTVAVRMPSNKIAKSLIELTRCPIAAPSANRSGKTSPTHAEHVIEDLSGRIPMIIDGGPCQAGLESTVIDLQREPPLILRPGVLTLETLKKDIPNIQYYTSSIDKGALIEKPTTPGMKYRHYCPETPMILFQSEPNQIIEKIANYLNTTNEKKIKILLTTEIDTSKFTQVKGKDIKIKQLGTINTKAEVAHNLFAALRESDHECHDVILVQGVSEVEEGKAIMNRLRKAAKKII